MKKNEIIEPLPKIGGKYYYFDDGKIKITRRMEVIITEITPFNEIDSETLKLWMEEVEYSNDWLYAKETDYFVKANLKISDDKIENIVFVRTINNGGWFSLGWWGGRLDIDCSLNNKLNQWL